jgi:hypothetical protein
MFFLSPVAYAQTPPEVADLSTADMDRANQFVACVRNDNDPRHAQAEGYVIDPPRETDSGVLVKIMKKDKRENGEDADLVTYIITFLNGRGEMGFRAKPVFDRILPGDGGYSFVQLGIQGCFCRALSTYYKLPEGGGKPGYGDIAACLNTH